MQAFSNICFQETVIFFSLCNFTMWKYNFIQSLLTHDFKITVFCIVQNSFLSKTLSIFRAGVTRHSMMKF